MKNRRLIFILFPFGAVLFLGLGGWVVSWLWNALLPPLFGLPVIGFWQALGILALSRILSGGFGNSPGGRHRGKYRHGGPSGHFTAEERERIRQHLDLRSDEPDKPES